MEPHEKVHRSKKDIIINNFIGGFAWAFGVTVGLAIIGFLISKLDLVPIVGEFISDVNEYILQKHPQLIK